MPDLTISVTDAQWARIVAVSSYIKGQSGKGETGDVDSAYIVAKLKAISFVLVIL